MKKIFVLITLAACAIISRGFSEPVGTVDVDVKVPQGWKSLNKLENEKSTTIIYVPGNQESTEVDEYFGVHSNVYPINVQDEEALKTNLTTQLGMIFPNTKIEFSRIEKNDNSILFHWVAKEEDKEKAQGWTRLFATKKGMAIISYQTRNAAKADTAKDKWLPILKGANVKELELP